MKKLLLQVPPPSPNTHISVGHPCLPWEGSWAQFREHPKVVVGEGHSLGGKVSWHHRSSVTSTTPCRNPTLQLPSLQQPPTTRSPRRPQRLPSPGPAGCADRHLFRVAGQGKWARALGTASFLSEEEVAERTQSVGRWKLQCLWSQMTSLTSPRLTTCLCDKGCMRPLAAFSARICSLLL